MGKVRFYYISTINFYSKFSDFYKLWKEMEREKIVIFVRESKLFVKHKVTRLREMSEGQLVLQKAVVRST